MAEKIELRNGEWAHLRDPEEIPEGLRRPVEIGVLRLSAEGRKLLDQRPEDATDEDAAKSFALSLSADDMELLFELNDRMVCALVDEWSFDAPCPPSLEAVRALQSGDYRTLLEATATYTKELLPGSDFGPDGVTDPDSPTTPSSD